MRFRSDDPPLEPEICQVCGFEPDNGCECPECPVCGCIGDPDCYSLHGLARPEGEFNADH